jgi:hypothetical protein
VDDHASVRAERLIGLSGASSSFAPSSSASGSLQWSARSPLRIHDLRHTAVALAVEAGAHPKEIQELCGHASITTTLNVYGHLFESLQERLAERLDETFRAARAPYLPPEVAENVVPLRRRARKAASERVSRKPS